MVNQKNELILALSAVPLSKVGLPVSKSITKSTLAAFGSLSSSMEQVPPDIGTSAAYLLPSGERVTPDKDESQKNSSTEISSAFKSGIRQIEKITDNAVKAHNL